MLNEPTDRLDRLEREVVREGSLEMAAIYRFLHRPSHTTTDADPIAKVAAIVERIETLDWRLYGSRITVRNPIQ